jgi:hypothetical protein
MFYSSLGAKIKNLTEKGIFENIIACCVTKQTVQNFIESGRSWASQSRASSPPQVQGEAVQHEAHLQHPLS